MFFFPYCGLVVVMAVADGRVGCGWFFFSSGIYYSIVMVIIFYCDVYIILLC